MQSRHHFSLLILICAQTLCRMYKHKMCCILPTVAILFSLFNTKTHIKIVKYFVIAFTFWMRSLIPRKLQGENQIVSGTTDEHTAQFTPVRDQFSETASARALEGPLICPC